MHHSRFSTIIIDCQTEDLDAAASFWAQALGSEARQDPSAATYRGKLSPTR